MTMLRPLLVKSISSAFQSEGLICVAATAGFQVELGALNCPLPLYGTLRSPVLYGILASRNGEALMPHKIKPPLYSIWQGMKARCTNSNSPQWKDYGGRGISVCKEWKDSYAAFARDMGERPTGCILDRINNDGNYEPSNCRWATHKESQRNRRNTAFIDIGGKRYILAALAEEYGIKSDTIKARATKGLPFHQVIAQEWEMNIVGLAHGGEANGKRLKALTHCKHGHKFTQANTYIWIKGDKHYRQCRACHAERERNRIK